MTIFKSENLRNIALLGHGGSGKTSLAEAMLFNTGAVNRLGRWTMAPQCPTRMMRNAAARCRSTLR